MMSSPFPHLRARAAAEDMQKQKEDAKKTQEWELFWSSCCRAGMFILLILGGTIAYQVALRPHQEQRQLNLNFDRIVRHEPVNSSAPVRFFLDIASNAGTIINSQVSHFVENNGWTGVCAAPVSAGEVHNRACRVVSVPIGARDGEEVGVSDCAHSYSFQIWFNKLLGQEECPTVSATTVSVSKLLHIAAAPKVIDWIALETHNDEMLILNSFPFSEHCVRAWTIFSGQEAATIQGMKHTLEVSQGCRVRQSGSYVFGRCPCDNFGRLNATSDPHHATGSHHHHTAAGTHQAASDPHHGASESHHDATHGPANGASVASIHPTGHVNLDASSATGKHQEKKRKGAGNSKALDANPIPERAGSD